MIVKTDAIVLKTMRYRETSKIATLFTREYGKLSVIAKGARLGNSRVGPALDVLNHVHVVLYKKEGRDLHLLSQCDLLNHFGMLTKDMERMGSAIAVIELVHKVAHSEEESGVLFEAVLDALKTLNETPENFKTVLLHFEIHLLDILGFKPDLYACADCKTFLDPSGTQSEILRLRPGGIQCASCGKTGSTNRGISWETLRHLQMFQNLLESGKAAEIVPSRLVSDEAMRAVWYYFRSHVEGMNRLRSEEVFLAVA